LFESWITSKTGIEITFTAPVPQGDAVVCAGTSRSEYRAASVAGATAYNWSIIPEEAGVISNSFENATVSWSPDYTGPVRITLLVARNGDVSFPSGLDVNVAKLTRLISQPADSVMCAEKPVDLKAVAEGFNLTYNWFKNGNLLQSGPSNTISIPGAIVEDSGDYYCEISGVCGNAATGTSTLTVLPVTKINSINPDTEIPFGGDLTLDISTEGHNLIYEWLKDDSPADQGSSSNLVLNDVNATDIGLYQAKVTGTCGTVKSRKVYVYVKKKEYSGEPEVFIWPTVVTGEFSVAVSNDDTYSLLIHNTIGKLLRKNDNCRFQTTLDIGNLSAGIYIITVYNRSMIRTFRIIKK
jgi:hypothetical protein